MDSEVIIIGAGISGLSAAKWLNESGVSVIVLEARERVGGRTHTIKGPKVNYVDMGGSYVGPTQDRLLRLSEELGVENYKINEVEDCILYKDGQRTLFKGYDTPIRRNPLVNMDINYVSWLMDKMGEEIPANGPWNAPHADEWDTMTYMDFLNKHCWTHAAVEFFKNIITLFITSEPYEASLLSFLWYIKQCGGFRRMCAVTNGGQERKFHGGSQQISEKIAERLGDKVKKDSSVYEINQESKDVVLVKTLNGREYKAKYIILAIPPILQMKIHFTPSLPPLRNQLMQRVPMGSVMKVILYYRTPFWRAKGLCGSFLIEGDEHPVYYTLDETKPDGSFPAIVGFIVADKLRRLIHLSPDERKKMIAQSYATATGLPEFLEPVHYEEKNWMEEQYSGGCYTAMYPPGYFTRYGKHLRTPVDRLYFAGTETAIKWSGYMDGAIEAGERAAREILHQMGKITADKIWMNEPQHRNVVPLPFQESFREKYSPSVPGFLKIVTLSTVVGAAAVAFSKCPYYMRK